MPTPFYSRISIVARVDDVQKGVFNSHLQEYTCRDSWISNVAYGARDIVRQRASNLWRGRPVSIDQTLLMYLVHQHHENMQIETVTSMRDLPNSEFTIAQTISRLCRKYPSVTFEPFEGRLGFNDALVKGIKLVGDASVIPAFYWATLIMRVAAADKNPNARQDRPWKDVTQLFERGEQSYSLWADKEGHVAAWRDIVANGDQIPAKWHLTTGYGPLIIRMPQYGAQTIDNILQEVESRVSLPIIKEFTF